jgi:anti-sigma B factor antagonist
MGIKPAPLEFERLDAFRGYACLAISGEIDMSNCDRLHTLLVAILDEPGLERVELDLAALTFIDSRGVGVLVSAQRRAQARQIEFGVVNAHGLVLRVLQVLGVDKMLAALESGGYIPAGDRDVPLAGTATETPATDRTEPDDAG